MQRNLQIHSSICSTLQIRNCYSMNENQVAVGKLESLPNISAHVTDV